MNITKVEELLKELKSGEIDVEKFIEGSIDALGGYNRLAGYYKDYALDVYEIMVEDEEISPDKHLSEEDYRNIGKLVAKNDDGMSDIEEMVRREILAIVGDN